MVYPEWGWMGYGAPMGRPRSENPKSIPVTVKMSRLDLRILDSERGGSSRSAYLRNLLIQGRLHITPPPKQGQPVEVAILPTDTVEPQSDWKPGDPEDL